ncbi:protein of unknown function [Pseudomonas mediterranea]
MLHTTHNKIFSAIAWRENEAVSPAIHAVMEDTKTVSR